MNGTVQPGGIVEFDVATPDADLTSLAVQTYTKNGASQTAPTLTVTPTPAAGVRAVHVSYTVSSGFAAGNRIAMSVLLNGTDVVPAHDVITLVQWPATVLPNAPSGTSAGVALNGTVTNNSIIADQLTANGGTSSAITFAENFQSATVGHWLICPATGEIQRITAINTSTHTVTVGTAFGSLGGDPTGKVFASLNLSMPIVDSSGNARAVDSSGNAIGTVANQSELLTRIGGNITISGGKVAATIAAGDGVDAAANKTTLGTAGAGLTALAQASAYTAARAAKLDNLDATVSSRSIYAGADTAGTTTLLARLTAARAGYLDNLNVGGVVASHADVTAINQSSSRHLLLLTVGQFERPESGSTLYTIEARTFAADTGAAVDADSTPTLTATGQTSGSLSANLSAASNPETGVYRWTYTVASSATIEPLRFDVAATIAASTFSLSCYSQVADFVAATFTAGDRTNLTNAAADAATIAADYARRTDAMVLAAAYDAAKTAASQTSVDAIPTTPLLAANYVAPDNASIGQIKTQTDKLTFTVAGKLDANTVLWGGSALPTIGTSTLDASGVRGAIGMAAANLDTQLSNLSGGGSGGGTGTGDTEVNQDTGGTDTLRYTTSDGTGIDNAEVVAYLASDYAAGDFTRRGRTVTGSDGRWVAPLMLNAGLEYVIRFEKPGDYGPDTVTITIPSA